MTFECMKSERIKRRRSHFERPRRNQHATTGRTWIGCKCALRMRMCLTQILLFLFLLLCLRAKESVNLRVCLIPPTNHVLLAGEEKTNESRHQSIKHTHGVCRGFKEKFGFCPLAGYSFGAELA